MKQRNIKVSVVMASHNSALYLAEAIESVLSQTMEELELIVVDDCSTDESFEIASRYSRLDTRVFTEKLPKNSGAAHARNVGINHARGAWIGILDSDDIASQNRFSEQLKLASSERDLILIGSSSVSVDEGGHLIKEHRYPTDHDSLVRRLYTQQAFPPHSSMLFCKQKVLELNLFNIKFPRSQDYDLMLKLSEIGRVASVDQSLVKIRKHSNNISNTNGGKLQILYSTAACTCHFLRLHGFADPSGTQSEEDWQDFLNWIEKRLDEHNFFERRSAWAVARSNYLKSEHKAAAAVEFGLAVLRSEHRVALLREKFFGSSLPEKLAKEWMAMII